MAISKKLGDKIKKIRHSKDLYQVDLAAIVGISTSYMSSIEQGLRSPSLKTLTKIAKALKIPLHELMK